MGIVYVYYVFKLSQEISIWFWIAFYKIEITAVAQLV